MTLVAPQYETSGRKLMQFLRENKVVTESAKSIVPSMVRFMVGRDFSGSWWSLPQSSRLYNALQPIREHPDVHVCRLVQKRICFVHRSIWAPLLRLSNRLPAGAFDKIVETHEDSGAHSVRVVPTPEWAADDVRAEAASMSDEVARDKLVDLVPRAETLLGHLKL